MLDSALQQKLLLALYQHHFTASTDLLFSLREWAEAQNTDFNVALENCEILTERFHAEGVTFGPTAKITIGGIMQVESHNLVPDQQRKNDHIRITILKFLAEQRNSGSSDLLHYEKLLAETSLSRDDFFRNIDLLEYHGYLGPTAQGCYEITANGLGKAAECSAILDRAHEFENLKHSIDISPQQRGHELERLLEKLFIAEGWRCQRNVKRPGEETDLVINLEREYYLVEAKWQQSPIEPNSLRDFRGKVSARVGARGIFVSMSGFTDEACKDAICRLESSLILLFGHKDVDAMMSGEVGFNVLLNAKFDAAMSKRQILVDVIS